MKDPRGLGRLLPWFWFNGLAFNGPSDQELNVPGYDHIVADEIREVVQVRWDKKHGELHLFMIDPYKKRYSTFS